jgi:hypothetical protein
MMDFGLKKYGSMYSTIGLETASKDTPSECSHKFVEAGFKLTMKELPARRFEHRP